jgi:hypothetical protein
MPILWSDAGNADPSNLKGENGSDSGSPLAVNLDDEERERREK